MKISTNTIKKLYEEFKSGDDPFESGVETVVQKIGAQLGAVESTTPFGIAYKDVVIVRVVSCEQHPNADRLHVCLIDDSGVTKNVERNKDGLVQVVCGAPNVRNDLVVAWLPPGSTVPESYAKDPFVLEARELRGVVSHGMLASPKELALSDEHDGILEITEEIRPGTLFIDAFNLRNDSVIDIENKMFTHRPDCFGLIGVARELSGIQHMAYTSPDWYRDGMEAIYERKSQTALPLKINNELPGLTPRFVAATMSGIRVEPSPMFMKLALLKHGVKPINNVVDITNYVMLLTGQPLHAYDYDKVRALDSTDTATIAIRYPHASEKLQLLNGKEITPREEAIVISTATQPIGLGGVMGGSSTEVDENTTNVILECANFDMYSIRRTAMAHGLFTDAVTRFNKGQSPLQNKYVAEYAISLLQTIAHGSLADFQDVHDQDSLQTVTVHTTAAFINDRLGLSLTMDDIVSLLQNVEFLVRAVNDELSISVPFWRTDIAIPEDIVEEVGRLYGYDNVPLVLPERSITPVHEDLELALKSKVRAILSTAGGTEVLTYSFVHGDLLAAAGQNIDQAFQLSNALSPDLQFLRLSVTPSLLDKVHANIKSGYGEFGLFEIGKGHALEVIAGDEPGEWTNVAYVYAATDKVADKKHGAAFYQARYVAEYLVKKLGFSVAFRPVVADDSRPELSLARPVFGINRVAEICIDGQTIGYVGEYSAHVRKALKLPRYSAGFEIMLSNLVNLLSKKTYAALSRFPSVEQDITLQVSSDVLYKTLHEQVLQTLNEVIAGDMIYKVAPIAVYQPNSDSPKNLSFRISVTSYVTTLTDSAVAKILDVVSASAYEKLGAKRI